MGSCPILGLPVFACGKLQPIWQVSTYDASDIPSSPIHSHLLGAVATFG